MDYEVEERAKDDLEMTRKKSLGFCPLLRDNCRKDCVCYNEGKITKAYDKFRPIYPYCDNVLNSGVISVE